MSSKEDVLSGHLRERLAQLLRDIVGVVEDAVSQFREETLRTRLENQSLRRQLGDFLRAPDKPQARPRPPDQQLFALDRQPVCVPDGVEAPPASATERAAPPGPDDGLSEALLALPVPGLKEEPQAPPPRVIKREREESKVTPGKNCAADVRISKGGADVCATAPRETERNGHFGGGAAAAGAIVYECPRCDEIFAQAARLRLHLEQKPKSYACNWCYLGKVGKREAFGWKNIWDNSSIF
ncbi:uncharacterized protein LOC133514302 isoform X2 [Syngnathoides biaculeatus]|uniref:uncharacterized protein LOC133514302 isoform X2 n=1 Tax=Syngnathoides biaculeatus TaxID=300417 RepID=UPI002ADD371C|nr:uncharacterized protein LOC133514302 isoform X2 [Syngnathoides biaculeatus]XP_061701862.1 uncharacterized protein LOC133514302 isoform X2 [Syngnathoides biaculeatus]